MRQKKAKAIRMSPQQKLIKFMQLKARYLADELGIEEELYFNKLDAAALAKVNTADANRAWENIKLAILKEEIAPGYICPFCELYLDDTPTGEDKCSCCPYGKHHGICNTGDDDFDKISDIWTNKQTDSSTMFPLSVLEQFVEQIEGDNND